MASRFPSKGDAKLRPRKGHDMTWSCDKHGEPISFRCKKHKVCVCHKCATKGHAKRSCELEDIEDVIFEMKGIADDTLLQIEDGQKHLKQVQCELLSCGTFASNHVKAVKDVASVAFKEKRNLDVESREQKDIRTINEEADEEIRIINEKRDKRIRERKMQTEMQHNVITEKQAKVVSESNTIDGIVAKRVEELKWENEHKVETMNMMVVKIKQIQETDETLVNETPQVIATLEENYNWNTLQDVTDYLEQIKIKVQRVRFVEGEFGGEHYARIDGYVGKWELAKSIDFPEFVGSPFVCSAITDDEICVRDDKKNDMYITNITTLHTEKVIDGKSKTFISSCAPVDDKMIVCGKSVRYSSSMYVCIALYDRKWKVVREITIPKNTASHNSQVFVDVDKDGMILAAAFGQSNIYVLNPADGKIVNTITKQGKKVWGAIHAMSSGDIIVETRPDELSIISRSGEENAVIHDDERGVSACRLDKLTDTLFITYRDKERGLYAVDHASPDGNILERRIVEYGQTDSDVHLSACLLTHSGNLVACNGEKMFVFKKKFII